ncbi:hypothetical protein EC835_1023 [Providencia alcalifaciens]|uniref:Uncharacterized protein n=1 Tax=Providencia alcalifaciens TaxID=126385 RepID=A0A4V2V403_9GAMM|nr:hypothetical protein [Providencia alcalifaciens]TCT36554.1 hypothetical protein EC835_1023 [Providencia alcalifaciens]
MKFIFLFFIMIPTISFASKDGSESNWYDGCPKYTDEKINTLKDKKVETIEELIANYSLQQLEEMQKEIECDKKNLDEQRKVIIQQLKNKER